MRYNDAVAAFERAAWLARAHDGDDVAQQARHPRLPTISACFRPRRADAARAQEYEAAAMATKTAALARGLRRNESRDGF